MKQSIQVIEKTVNSKLATVRLSDELDRSYSKLTGIAVLDNIGDKGLLSTSSVEGNELFPKDFEVRFLQSSHSVAPDQRFFTIDREAKGNRIEIEFKDGGQAPSYPYQLRIYLRLNND